MSPDLLSSEINWQTYTDKNTHYVNFSKSAKFTEIIICKNIRVLFWFRRPGSSLHESHCFFNACATEILQNIFLFQRHLLTTFCSSHSLSKRECSLNKLVIWRGVTSNKSTMQLYHQFYNQFYKLHCPSTCVPVKSSPRMQAGQVPQWELSNAREKKMLGALITYICLFLSLKNQISHLFIYSFVR